MQMPSDVPDGARHPDIPKTDLQIHQQDNLSSKDHPHYFSSRPSTRPDSCRRLSKVGFFYAI